MNARDTESWKTSGVASPGSSIFAAGSAQNCPFISCACRPTGRSFCVRCNAVFRVWHPEHIFLYVTFGANQNTVLILWQSIRYAKSLVILIMNWGRKRIRGLRRHFRNLRQRAKRPSKMRPVDLTWLAHSQQTYHKVIAHPWLSCKYVPRKQEFRALWLARFVQTLPYWYAQLKRKYSAFYLAIELYEPTAEDFCQSRLMVAVNERRLLHENLFGVAQDMPLPVEYMAVPGIETLDWRAYAQQCSYTHEEFERAGTRLANRPHRQVETVQGESSIIVHFGWVWVGQARNQ